MDPDHQRLDPDPELESQDIPKRVEIRLRSWIQGRNRNTSNSESFFGLTDSAALGLSLSPSTQEILVPFELGAKIGVLKPHSRPTIVRATGRGLNCRDRMGYVIVKRTRVRYRVSFENRRLLLYWMEARARLTPTPNRSFVGFREHETTFV